MNSEENKSFSYFGFAVTPLNHRGASDYKLLIPVSSLSLTKCVLSSMVSVEGLHITVQNKRGGKMHV